MIRDLGEGLILRRGTAADAEALAAFNADVLRPQDSPEPQPRLGAWTRDLMTGSHPTFTPNDAAVVEDTRIGAIVSSTLLISQTWSFGGIPMGFVRAVAPVLERRVAESPVAGHTGELRLSFYRSGLRLVLERGRLARVEAWQPTTKLTGQEWGMPSADERRATAMFPDLTFLQLLFGFRSLQEIETAFPDCIVRTNEARAPHLASDVLCHRS